MEPTEDRILEAIKNDPDVERSAHEVIQLEELYEHPGWKYLTARFGNFRKGAIEALARRLMAGQTPSPEQIAFERGYATAIVDLTKFPDRLQKELERATERAWERAQQESSEYDDEQLTPGG